MSQDINMIVTCDHTDCPYNHEKECGKDILYANDPECIAQAESEAKKMSDYIMNRESLRRHCEEMCKRFKDAPTSGAYGEHRFVLDLLEQTEWIPISERLPEEHEWIGTETFGTTISDEVYVTFESPTGERFTKHLSFQNGKVSDYMQREIDAFHKGSVPISWKSLPIPDTCWYPTPVGHRTCFAGKDGKKCE